jgi:hypothetical protein
MKMCIKSIEAAKQKANVITTFMQEKGVTLAHSNALHLVGRMEGFDNWHAYRKTLVAGGPLSKMGFEDNKPAQMPLGLTSTIRETSFATVRNIESGLDEWWKVEWRTDADGNWPTPARHQEEESVREVQLLEKEGYLSSVVRVNGQPGILFEMPYYCTESAPDVAAMNPDVRPYAETTLALARWHQPLLRMFSGSISAVIPHRTEVPGGHAALWVFMHSGSLSKQEREQLDNWLQRVGYPDFKW